MDLLSKPLTLPCGVILKNRITKSCMSDSLGDGCGNPTPQQIRLYERWAQGGVAMSCIGEVQVDPRYPEKPGNLVLPLENDNEATKAAATDEEKLFRELTCRATGTTGAHLWAQLGHAGALTHLPINPTPKGPSVLNVEELHCEALTLEEIQAYPAMYAKGAAKAKELGFTGVLVHAGHGFLLSQFLSPLFNKRNDNYGGSVEGRCRLFLEIINAVRQAVGPAFPVAVRINSSDQLDGGLIEEDALEVLKLLDATSVDLIDISGGTYFPGAKSSSESTSTKGGPYFLDFCRKNKAQKCTTKPIMLTGGFKTRQQAIEALSSGCVDMVGIARAMALNSNLANQWTNTTKDDDKVVDPAFPRFQATVPGGVTAWFTMRLTALAEDREDSFDLDLAMALAKYEARDAIKTKRWKEKFQIM